MPFITARVTLRSRCARLNSCMACIYFSCWVPWRRVWRSRWIHPFLVLLGWQVERVKYSLAPAVWHSSIICWLCQESVHTPTYKRTADDSRQSGHEREVTVIPCLIWQLMSRMQHRWCCKAFHRDLVLNRVLFFPANLVFSPYSRYGN